MEISIKKCPFCNSTPNVVSSLQHCSSAENYFTTENLSLKCKCGTWVYTVPVDGSDNGYDKALSLLVNEWNRRLSHADT